MAQTIKFVLMKLLKLLIVFFIIPFSYGQAVYNGCNSALELCPNIPVSVNNIGANKTLCGGCEDDFTFCFTPINTIWLKFTTNATGGDIQINLSNPVFQTQAGQDNRYNASLIQANVPCNSTSYTAVGNCISAATGFQSLMAPALTANTTYYVVLSGEQSGAGITIPAEFNINVSISGTAIDRPGPFVNMGIVGTICKGEWIPVMADRGNCQNPGPFRWYVNGILTAVTTSDSIFFTSDLQNGDIVSVESDCFTSCPVTISQTLPPVTVVDVLADAGNDQTIKAGEVTQLNGVATINSEIEWTPSYALSNQTILDPIANPQITTTYTLKVTDTINHCTAYDYVTINVEKGLFIPTTFSPNGDGENDTWVILGIESFPDCLLNIYNRWGQSVFQATGYNLEKAWNGRIKSGDLNESVYFYELQLRDPEKQVLKGSITLIR